MQDVLTAFTRALDAFSEDDGWAIASHIALSVLMALFPFLIFLTALAGFIGSAQLADEAALMLFEVWPETVARPIAAEVHNVLTQSHSGLLTAGAALALYFASSGIEAVRVGLNRAYDVRERRSWWLLRIESIVCVLIGAVALLTLAFAVILAPLLWRIALGYLPDLEKLGRLFTLGRFAISITVLAATLVIAHKWLPAERRSFRDILPGVVLTLGLSIGFGEAFAYYLAFYAANYVSTYAGLASFMIALAFLYTTAAIFLFGGELNAAFMHIRARKLRAIASSPPQSRPRTFAGP